MSQKNTDQEKTEIRIPNVSNGLNQALANIAESKGLTKSSFIRSELVKIKDFYESNGYLDKK